MFVVALVRETELRLQRVRFGDCDVAEYAFRHVRGCPSVDIKRKGHCLFVAIDRDNIENIVDCSDRHIELEFYPKRMLSGGMVSNVQCVRITVAVGRRGTLR